MRLKTFRGGVHLFENKVQVKDKPIEKMPVPKTVVIPLCQHTGSTCGTGTPAKPVVVPKSRVDIGTVIGEINGEVSANVHSSVKGIVKAVETRFHPVGTLMPSVIIETSSPDEWKSPADENYSSLSPTKIVERVKEAGIVGLGGAGFPTHIKLSPPPKKPIEIVILNGCECEPCLTGDYRLMLEKTKEIVEGGKLIMKAVGAKEGYIAIEDNKMPAVKKFQEVAGKDLEVCVLKTKYPEGGERQLIQAITGREVPSAGGTCGSGLPYDVGCLVQNVGTAFAVYEACKYRKPLIERVITVTGDVKEPKNLMVRIGTLFKDVIEYCGGAADTGKIIMGGPMMGIAQADGEVSVVKTTTGILVQSRKNLSLPIDEPCIRCGRCVDSCPMRLLPARIGDCIENKKFDEAKKLGLFDCIECGSCAWVCPSKRNLVHLYKYGKVKVK